MEEEWIKMEERGEMGITKRSGEGKLWSALLKTKKKEKKMNIRKCVSNKNAFILILILLVLDSIFANA